MAISWNFASCSCPSWNSSMDESALRRALDNLADCSSSLHSWFGFWTSLVVAGVALEIVFVVWEYIEELHDCKRCLVRPPVKPNLLLFLLGLLGAGLVAVGVAGELNVEDKIATVETCVRRGNDELSLLLSKEAGDAKDSALIAKGAADDAAQLVKQLGQYVGVVARSVNPRRINRSQFMQLMKGQPKATVEIWYDRFSFDSEVQAFVSDLNANFGKDGLDWPTKVRPFSDDRD